ncbi:MAG: cell division/cell wall cluster transcriptional repressor MraZ [Clostridiales bacterium GWE2_32_10]|nr:MAG: cell division/cell wall cluster transcriptional repressor MraZ [Clostridiales bacterium GWE2_32_10]HBY21679.1 cell division/cell wall cluster transcriptional repressor MraZ [Clostridiales bacterium]
MFIGEYEHSVDEKGRVLVPSKFRAKLGERFIVTKGLEACLYIYTMDEWTKFEEKLKALPFSSKDARKFTRFFLAGAEECEIDKQGRILIPANLREYAKLEKAITSIGVSNRIEIWSTDKWNEYNEDESFDASELAEKMADLGI